MLRMLALWLMACTIPVGEHHAHEGTVVEVGGASVIIEHEGVEGVVDAGSTSFASDPNLSRTVTVGDEVDFFFLETDDGPRVIGFEVTGHTELRPTVVGPGEVFPDWTVPATGGDVVLGQGQEGSWVIGFLFTRCGMADQCPLLASKLKALQPELPDGVRMLAVTLDPEFDTLDVLQTYGQGLDADPALWRFGALPLSDLQVLLKQAGASREKVEQELRHNLRLLVLDDEGKLVFSASDNTWASADVLAALE
jgi:protein SCO1